MKKILFTILLAPIFCLSQQTINKTMFFDGLNRQYIVYVPQSYDGTTNMPILFSFHGGAGYAQDMLQLNDMRPIADTAGFIAVYPQGAIDSEADIPTTSWIHKMPTTHNDVNFISAIIDTLSAEYLINEKRVYACGYSEGGIFSYELGCRLNNRIAAFVSVSGSMITESLRADYGFGLCTPSHPTAVMLIPGTNDFSFHSMYDGFQPYYMSVNEITTYWSTYNATDTNPIIDNLNNISQNDGSTVQRKSWVNGQNCVMVEELKINGGGHDWPGSFGNMDIDATQEIWNFVSKFDTDGLINCNSVSVDQEILSDNKKKILKITDIFGRTIQEQTNQLLFYIYDDGTVEKKIKLK